jgi:hypothetical protein
VRPVILVARAIPLLLNESKDIRWHDLRDGFLYRIEEDLEVMTIAFPGIGPTTMLQELEVGIYFGDTQRQAYNFALVYLFMQFISHITLLSYYQFLTSIILSPQRDYGYSS